MKGGNRSMGFFNSMDVSASGLTAQRLRLDVISNNIANVATHPNQRRRSFSERKGYFPRTHNEQKF